MQPKSLDMSGSLRTHQGWWIEITLWKHTKIYMSMLGIKDRSNPGNHVNQPESKAARCTRGVACSVGFDVAVNVRFALPPK